MSSTALPRKRENSTPTSQPVLSSALSAALETKLLARATASPLDDASESKRLAQLIVETDHQLSRAVASIGQWEETRNSQAIEESRAIEEGVAKMGGLARWFARRLLAILAERRAAREPDLGSPALEGLSMVLARLRQSMRDQGIDRVDVLGQPFDAESMHAIGTVASSEFPAGHVAEQLSPAYRWRNRVLRFADVRVADDKTKS